MSETLNMDATVIDEKTYQALLGMLKSTSEDQIVALLCIKDMNKERNLAAIMFLMKNSTVKSSLWEENCKGHLRYQASLISISISNNPTFKEIYAAIDRESKYKTENQKFFTARYVEYLKQNLMHMPHVEEVEINVKIKNYE
jgi:hypothetical protein